MEEMLRDPEVDVVVVSTIPDTHVEFTKGALEAGKHGRVKFQSTLYFSFPAGFVINSLCVLSE